MDVIVNFGDPHKDFEPIADELLGEYDISYVPITNCRKFCGDELQIVDASYGRAMVLDTLHGLFNAEDLSRSDRVLFLGSMGGLTKDILLGDLVVPVEVYSNVLSNKYEPFTSGQKIFPDQGLVSRIMEEVEGVKAYKHGSVLGVFDPTTDHKTYTTTLYDGEVVGVDCSETYTGLDFCLHRGIRGAALLYCSDDPSEKINSIEKEEFDKRAFETDLLMHRYAMRILG